MYNKSGWDHHSRIVISIMEIILLAIVILITNQHVSMSVSAGVCACVCVPGTSNAKS